MCIEEQLYIDQPWVEAIFYSMYAAILVVGVGSNLVVLYVILGNKHMRTTINIYLLNLAVSDIIICVFASSSFLNRWQFLGSWMCNLTIFGITVNCVSAQVHLHPGRHCGEQILGCVLPLR